MTNFDTHIPTVTPGELARRGHAKSKRADLRVVGLGVLVSETGHVPLLHRTYAGNASDHRVLKDCLQGLGRLHDALDKGEGRKRPGERTLVRDGGSWSEQMELNLDVAGYYTIVSLPLGTLAGEQALEHAAGHGAMKPLTGKLAAVRAARLRTRVGDLDRTLVVVESEELLEGQKRGIAAALRKAKAELSRLERRVAAGRIHREALQRRVAQTLGHEHLAAFVVVHIEGTEQAPTFRWEVDATKRRQWSALVWGSESCVPTDTIGPPSASSLRFVDNGTWKKSSAEPRKAALSPGDLPINGPAPSCAFTPLRQS